MPKLRHIPYAVLTAGSLLVGGGAYAQSMPSIDWREANQQQRIDNGIRDGQLSRGETARLEQGQQRIDRTEARDAARGPMTSQERQHLNGMENRQSGNIYRDRHDDQHAWGGREGDHGRDGGWGDRREDRHEARDGRQDRREGWGDHREDRREARDGREDRREANRDGREDRREASRDHNGWGHNGQASNGQHPWNGGNSGQPGSQHSWNGGRNGGQGGWQHGTGTSTANNGSHSWGNGGWQHGTGSGSTGIGTASNGSHSWGNGGWSHGSGSTGTAGRTPTASTGSHSWGGRTGTQTRTASNFGGGARSFGGGAHSFSGGGRSGHR